MRSIRDRLTGRRFYYQDRGVEFTMGEFKTVGHWSERQKRHVFLNPSRLSAAKFAALNPGKTQPECGNLHDLHPMGYDNGR